MSAIVAVVALLVGSAGAGAAPLARQASLHDLAFMAGCWRSAPDERGTVIEEHYTGPSDNLMLGTTRYLREGAAVSFEFTRISVDDEGMSLRPYPNGRPSTAVFRLTALEEGVATFEAPEHDFPRRIRYRLESDGALVARIDDGSDDGQAAEWRMSSAPCGVR